MTQLIIGTAILAALGQSSERSTANKTDECRATYVYSSDEPQTIKTRFAEWSVHAILIGCAKALDSITADDKRKTAEVLRAVFTESDLHLIVRIKTPAFREDVVKRINRALRRTVVSDIAFLRASRAE